MTDKKKKEIITWMCKHWDSEDVFDDAVQHFGKDDKTIMFCEKIALKLEKAFKKIPNYLEKEIK